MREKLKSTNLACTLAGMAKSTWYYKPKENLLNNEISDRMKEIAIERPRFGSPRMTVLIRREFGTVNHKRIERLYKEARLTLPRERRKRKWHGRKNQMFVPLGPSQRWSMDFMEDKTVDGRRIRIFNVVDDFSREAIICQAERSFSGHRIVRELEQVMESRDIKPQSIV
jgi:putative transposase